jgi:hypothetical protein
MTVSQRDAGLGKVYHRVLVKPIEADWNASWDPLPILPQQELGAILSDTGYDVVSYTRTALPSIGEAIFEYQFDEVNNRVYTARDLTGYDVRIQAWRGSDATKRTTTVSGAGWRTVWWGVVEYHDDDISRGVRTYRAIEGLAARARSWRLNRHVYEDGGATRLCLAGHPGFNQLGADGRLAGDRSSSNSSSADPSRLSSYYAHTWPGKGSLWTDQEVIETILAIQRTSGDPDLSFSGTPSTLQGTQAWSVEPDQTVWDLLTRVGDRRRGRGTIFLSYGNDSSNPTGPLTVQLSVSPQEANTVSYTEPASGSTATILGALAEGTAGSVNVAGDHRLVDGSMRIGQRHEHTADRVEVIGAPIQTLVTLAHGDSSLGARWSGSEATAFAALDPTSESGELARRANRWSHVYRLFGLSTAWGGTAGNGEGGASSRADYRCDDSGGLVVPSTTADSNPAMYRIRRDLPIYGGVDYSTASPARYDGDATITDRHRERLKLLAYDGSDWVDLQSEGFTAQVTPDGILVYATTDMVSGDRSLGDTGATSLGSIRDYTELAVTCAIESDQHRLQMSVGRGADISRRTVRIMANDLHLWLAHPGAIWSLDPSTGTPSRSAAGATSSSPGILRDDRDRLARILNQARLWYLTERRSLTYAMNDVGPLGDTDGGSTYPTLGDLITTISYTNGAGQTVSRTINTPVTSITVDARASRTTWRTDWQELAL